VLFRKKGLLPLTGRRIAVTRAQDQLADLVNLLESKGAEPISFPTIVILPPEDWAPLDEALDRISTYDWCIFTSPRAVEAVASRLKERSLDAGVFRGVRIATIGPKTARAVKALGATVACIPEEYRAEAIVEALGPELVKGRRFLLPRARIAREVLPDAIRSLGGEVDVVEAYRTEAPQPSEVETFAARLMSGHIDAVTFTSSSTVRNCLSLLADYGGIALFDGVAVACIGPITAETARQMGLIPAVVAKVYTIEGLVEALVEYFSPKHRSL
jgi:uroporphyrinogen III methyltransferase/synthase